MLISSKGARTGAFLLACAVCASALPVRDGPSVFAADAAGSLQKRAIMRGDNYVPLGDTTVPLSPLLLVFGGLGAAAVGLVIAFIRIMIPSCMSRTNRIILEERERARQDLRVRGAVSPRGSPGNSPTPGTPITQQQRRFPPNKPMRKVGRNSRGSYTPGSLTPGETASMSSTAKRPSHGYRGTSFSLAEARKNSDKSHRFSLSGVALPLLNSNDSSSGSSSFHVNARDVGGMSERAKYPITATNERPVHARNNSSNRRLSFGTKHLNRTSSIGKGADLQRTRSGRQQPDITLAPQSMDAVHAQKWGRRESYTHPLAVATTSPSRRDSALSYEAGSSAEHSYMEQSRFGSIGGNPLQPLSAAGLGGGSSQPWASPRSTSRSPSPEFVSPDPSRLAVAEGQRGASRNSSVSGLLDSDGSEHGAAPQTAVLIPSRATSITR